MTKQEILETFNDIDFVYNDSSKHETLSRMLDELLKEQDQTRPVFNGRYWECEKCGEMYQDILEVRKYRHCPWCGRRFEA